MALGKHHMGGRNRFHGGGVAASAVVLCGVSQAPAQSWTAVRLHSSAFSDSGALAVSGDWQGGAVGIGQSKPVLWHSSSKEWINLAPGVGDSGIVFGMHGDRQAGLFNAHATLWSGTAQSRIDLHPAWAQLSAAHAVWGSEQVGWAGTTVERAALWRGSAASYVDLHPAGAVQSRADAVAVGHQGGAVEYPHPVSGTVQHAALWSGSAASFIDLNPPGASGSFLLGMSPGQQVGAVVYPTTALHATLWTGTPESAIDLHPIGIQSMSRAYGTCGSAQVGQVMYFTGNAVIWFGSAQSVVNLHDFLPSGQYFQSEARAVSFYNGQYYVAGTAWTTVGHVPEAWLWVGVPAPASALALVGLVLIVARRHRASA